MNTDDLVAVFKNQEVEFGYMRGITQRMVFNFFPLLAEGKMGNCRKQMCVPRLA